jgi:hypothetical protein
VRKKGRLTDLLSNFVFFFWEGGKGWAEALRDPQGSQPRGTAANEGNVGRFDEQPRVVWGGRNQGGLEAFKGGSSNEVNTPARVEIKS